MDYEKQLKAMADAELARLSLLRDALAADTSTSNILEEKFRFCSKRHFPQCRLLTHEHMRYWLSIRHRYGKLHVCVCSTYCPDEEKDSSDWRDTGYSISAKLLHELKPNIAVHALRKLPQYLETVSCHFEAGASALRNALKQKAA